MIPQGIIKVNVGFQRRAVTVLTATVIWLSLAQAAFAQQGGAANFFYDANGRLTAVLSPTGEAAIYNYDPAGNFTSITRRAANELSIIGFTPGAGGVGTSVTIYGTGFSDTPSANTVKFNGVPATVAAATKTLLTVTVPSGATTGPLNVTNSNGSVNSSESFLMGGSNVEFYLPIAFGGSEQFLFNNPPSGQQLTNVGMLTFNGVAGQRVSLIVEDLVCGLNSNPPPFAYAQISLISPSGAIITTTPFQNYQFSGGVTVALAYVDALTLTATGEYTILIDPTDSLYPQLCGGQLKSFGATARLYDTPADITGTIAASGLPTPVNLNTPGQNAVLTFNGLNGQRICLQGSQDVATVFKTEVKVYSPGTYPGGAPLITQALTSSFFVDTTTLTTNGTYTILVDPELNKTRTAVLTLYDVPPDVTGSLTIGAQPTTVSIPSVGQAAVLTFTVAASQSVTVHIPGNFVGGDNKTTVSLLRSDNTVVTSMTSTAISFDLSPQTLTSGTYKVKIDPDGTNAGNVTINLTTP
jgi:YD repeat-containing protein